MEIQAKPITFDDRIEHLLKLSENQIATKKKFPWGIAITYGIMGAGAVIMILYLIQRKNGRNKKRDESQPSLH